MLRCLTTLLFLIAIVFSSLLTAILVSTNYTLSTLLNLEVQWSLVALDRTPLPFLPNNVKGFNDYDCAEWWSQHDATKTTTDNNSDDDESDDNFISIEAVPNVTDAQPRVRRRNSKIPRVHVCKLFGRNGDGEEYSRLYDGKKPVIITGAMEHWKSMRNWSGEHFGGTTSPYKKSIIKITKRSRLTQRQDFEKYYKKHMELQASLLNIAQQKATLSVLSGATKPSKTKVQPLMKQPYNTDPDGYYNDEELDVIRTMSSAAHDPKDLTAEYRTFSDHQKSKEYGDYVFLEPKLFQKHPELWDSDVTRVPTFLADDITPFEMRRKDGWGDKSFFWAMPGSRSSIHRDPYVFFFFSVCCLWVAVGLLYSFQPLVPFF